MSYVIFCPELKSYLFYFDFCGSHGKQDYRFESTKDMAILIESHELATKVCDSIKANPSFNCSPKTLEIHLYEICNL